MGTTIRRCGWCKKILGTKPCDDANDGEFTDTICDDCREAERERYHRARAAQEDQEAEDRISPPICGPDVVDGHFVPGEEV